MLDVREHVPDERRVADHLERLAKFAGALGVLVEGRGGLVVKNFDDLAVRLWLLTKLTFLVDVLAATMAKVDKADHGHVVGQKLRPAVLGRLRADVGEAEFHLLALCRVCLDGKLRLDMLPLDDKPETLLDVHIWSALGEEVLTGAHHGRQGVFACLVPVLDLCVAFLTT